MTSPGSPPEPDSRHGTLYENDEETVFNATRPVITNGIADVVTRPDLLDRAIVVRPPRIPDENRRDESGFWAEFERVRPQVLGALLDAAACALRQFPNTTLDAMPRMADFARWVVAAEPELGLEKGAFLAAYQLNREDAHELALDEDPVVQAVANHVAEHGSFVGTAGELAAKLHPDRPPKGWPTTGQAMAGALRRAAPVLRAHPMTVEYDGSARRRTWTLIGTSSGERGANGESGARASDQEERRATSPSNNGECGATSGASDTNADQDIATRASRATYIADSSIWFDPSEEPPAWSTPTTTTPFLNRPTPSSC